MLELPTATLLNTAPAIMSYMAIKLTLSVIIPDFQNNAKPISESLSFTRSLDLMDLKKS